MGEFELLARVRERLPAAGPRGPCSGSGDDAAVTVPGGATATSVDALVEGVHFRRERRQPGARSAARRSPPRSPTWRRWAPSRARPTSSSACPPTSTRTSCLELLDGMIALAAATGDDARRRRPDPRRRCSSLAVTVVGHAPAAERARHRAAGAVPGDALVLTGELGGAAAGLLAAERAARRGATAERAARGSSSRRRGSPPAAPWRAAGATAMIDLSDGLGADAGHLAEASGVGPADRRRAAAAGAHGRRRESPRRGPGPARLAAQRRRGLRAAGQRPAERLERRSGGRSGGRVAAHADRRGRRRRRGSRSGCPAAGCWSRADSTSSHEALAGEQLAHAATLSIASATSAGSGL